MSVEEDNGEMALRFDQTSRELRDLKTYKNSCGTVISEFQTRLDHVERNEICNRMFIKIMFMVR